MKLQFSQNPGLPPLAWLTTVSLTDHLTTVVHGRWLESQEGGLVEGIGDGSPKSWGSAPLRICSAPAWFVNRMESLSSTAIARKLGQTKSL